MNAGELVRRAEDLGIELTLVGDKIRYASEDRPPPRELVAEMKRNRDELVSILSRRQALQWPPPRNVPHGAGRTGPLSWAQRRVWATSFFFDDGTYNLSGGLRLIGRLDRAAFDAAIADMRGRHPSLRTVFMVEEGAPSQHILANGGPPMVLRDFADQPSDAAFDACLRECETIAAKPLALDETPPVRMRLYRLAAEDHVFFVVLHHVIADGVSVRVLMDDLGRCYSARIDGGTVGPPSRDVDMIDYARFEEEYLECANLGSTRRYWRKVLDGAELGPLPLPPRPQPGGSDDTGGALEVVIDAATTTGVRRLASAGRSTPFQVVSAAISSVLSRFTGCEDIVVGMPVARRGRPGLDKLVGLLLDMVPIRLDVRGNPTFLELVQRTRTAILGAMGNAVVPVELIIDDPPIQRAGEQLFNVVFTDSGTKLGNPLFHGLDARPVAVARVGAKFDLNFLVRDDGDTLRIDVEFDRRALDESDVRAMTSMAQRVLAQGASDPGNRVLDLAAMPAIATPARTVPALGKNAALSGRRAALAETRGDAVGDAISSRLEPAAPQDGAEALLFELFRKVLYDASISTDTNFFDRGGDSMRAIRLVSLAGDRGLVFGVRDVYAAPRLADLAARAMFRNGGAEASRKQAAFSLLPADVAGSFDDTVEDAYPVTALQFGMMYLKERAPESGVYHIVLSYRVGGRMDPHAFRAAAQDVTDRHPVLRTSFDLGHPSGPIQRVHARVEVPVEFDDLRHLGPAEQIARIAQVVERERGRDFDLTRPALFRLVVLKLSDDDYQLLFTHHHAILDGWSVTIFFEDLHTRYMQNLAGEPAARGSPLRSVFADYVALEQSAKDEPTHLKFWKARTSPGSGLVAPNRSSTPVMRQLRVEMREGMAAELRSIASELGVPIKALLLAAHIRVMAWMTGRDEVVTGHVVNCRPETRDSDRTLGLFLSKYPMRVRLRRQTWAELAQEVHLDEQAMMPHRWYPYALVQQHHGPMPIFDSYFNFTDFHTIRRLVSNAGLKVLDVNEIESTHYAFGINYTLDVRTGELRLIVEYDESALARAAVALAADAHDRALAAILADPQSLCISSSVPGIVDVAHLLGHGAGSPVSGEPAATARSGSLGAPGARREPQTPLERSVRSVWIEVLGADDLDMHASFFDLGGTSLSAMRVVSRLRALHGDLSMETFMNAPTIAEVARSLAVTESRAAEPSPSPSVSAFDAAPLKPEGPRQYPLTRAQKHLWQLANRLPGVPLFGMPGALRAEGPLDLDVLERTFASLLDRHAALRTRIATTDAGPVQVVDPYAELDLQTIDLRTSSDPVARCEQLMARALLEPMDMTRSPLVRAIVFRVSDDLHVIYLNIHHVVCDGWSMALLMSEAAQIYRDLSRAIRVPSGRAAPVGIGELAQAEADWTNSPRAAAQRRYWVDRLAPPWPSLGAGDDSRSDRREQPGLLERFRSASCRRRLPPTVVESVSGAARRHGLTKFMVVLTAFASTLRARGGHDDIRVATMMANRVQPEREHVIGLLTNTVVLRLLVEANYDRVDLSMQARHVCIEAYERQELPFEDVLASLNARYPAEDRIGQVFEAMLLMQEETPEVEPHAGLRLAPYTPERGALQAPVTPTTCTLVLAATVAGGELVLDLQYMPAMTDAAAAETLLDDIVAAIGATARALRERA